MSTPKKAPPNKEMNFDGMLCAIKYHLVEKKGVRPAAREYGVDESTLRRYAKKVSGHFGDDISAFHDDVLMDFLRTSHMHLPSNMVFSIEQEKVLLEYVLKCVSHYYGLSITELKQVAFQFAVKLQVDYPSNWNEHSMASRQWYRGFMKRHNQLTLRTPEQTSMNRVKSFSKSNVDKFFANLSQLLDEHHFDASCIYNMDESGFPTVPTKIGKVIASKGVKRVGQLEAAERGTTVTMALTVSANGNSIPPFFLFPRKNMQSTFLDNVSSGSAGFANGSGWMCQPEFVRFISHFIKFSKSSKKAPVLLLMDNHTSHLSVEALDLAVENGVHILTFPPHCSHRMQPLDVSVFGPIKSYYKSQCSAWQKNNANKVLEIRHVAGLVCKTLDLALTAKTIKAGFSATGIYPFNPNIFSDADFVQLVEQNKEEVEVEAGLDEEEQRRIVVDSLDVGREKEVSSIPSSSFSQSASTSMSSLLEEIGPLQATAPKTPSKRGRKAMKTTVLTSPDNIANLKVKDSIKQAKAPKKATSPAKRPKKKKSSPPSDEDLDFCIICLRFLPKKLTAANAIKCNTCHRPVHLKCANMGNRSFFTCKHCDSDFDEEEEGGA